MTEPDWKAELLEDRSGSLHAPGSTVPEAPLDPAWRVGGIVVALALALAVVVLYSPKPQGVATASVSPPTADLASVPTAAPSPTAPPGGPCVTDPIEVAVPPDGKVPESFGSIQVPAGGRAAFVVAESRRGGSIVIAGQGLTAGDSQVVATYATSDVVATVEATIVNWSTGGGALLLLAHELGASGGEQPCSNLFLIDMEKSRVRQLTSNGPGMTIGAAALAPSGDRVAYVQAGELNLRDLTGGGGPVADCPGVGFLQWALDERRVLATCDGAIVTAEPFTGASNRFEPPDGWYPLFASWADHERPITLLAGGASEGDELGVFDVDPGESRFERRPGLDLTGAFVRSISPGGRWLVALSATLEPQDPAAMFAVDLTTGARTHVPAPDRIQFGDDSFGWLPDGDTVLYPSFGKLYASNLATATLSEVGSLPTSQFAWVNLPP
jgi:hypothetical protein